MSRCEEVSSRRRAADQCPVPLLQLADSTAGSMPGSGYRSGKGLPTTSAGVTIYPTDEDGNNACKRQLRLILQGQSTSYPVGISFRQLARTWIFGNRDLTILEEQTAFNWARTVAQTVGAMVDTPLDDWRNA